MQTKESPQERDRGEIMGFATRIAINHPKNWERRQAWKDICFRYGHVFEDIGLPGNGYNFSWILHTDCKRCGAFNPKSGLLGPWFRCINS